MSSRERPAGSSLLTSIRRHHRLVRVEIPTEIENVRRWGRSRIVYRQPRRSTVNQTPSAMTQQQLERQGAHKIHSTPRVLCLTSSAPSGSCPPGKIPARIASLLSLGRPFLRVFDKARRLCRASEVPVIWDRMVSSVGG
jgi:hypothetical protein